MVDNTKTSAVVKFEPPKTISYRRKKLEASIKETEIMIAAIPFMHHRSFEDALDLARSLNGLPPAIREYKPKRWWQFWRKNTEQHTATIIDMEVFK